MTRVSRIAGSWDSSSSMSRPAGARGSAGTPRAGPSCRRTGPSRPALAPARRRRRHGPRPRRRGAGRGGPGVDEQRRADLGEAQRARAAGTLEHRCPDETLERRHLLAHRRLRVAELLGGSADGAVLDDGDEGDQMTDFEAGPGVDRHGRQCISATDGQWQGILAGASAPPAEIGPCSSATAPHAAAGSSAGPGRCTPFRPPPATPSPPVAAAAAPTSTSAARPGHDRAASPSTAAPEPRSSPAPSERRARDRRRRRRPRAGRRRRGRRARCGRRPRSRGGTRASISAWAAAKKSSP